MPVICIRQRLAPVWRNSRRQMSFTRPPNPLSTGAGVPSEKLRALVSLYHLADTLITPENLPRKIDEAFIPTLREDNRGIMEFGGPPSARMRTAFMVVQGMKETLEQRRQAPKVMEPEREMRSVGARDHRKITSWSGERRARERQVMEALYGVEGMGSLQVLPGPEVLVEEGERVEQEMKADIVLGL